MTTMLHVLSILFDFGSSLRLLIIQKNKQLSLFAEFEEVLIQKVALDLTSKETKLAKVVFYRTIPVTCGNPLGDGLDHKRA